MEEENTEKTQGWSLQAHPGHSDPHPPGNVGPDLYSNSSTNTHTLMHIHTHTYTHIPAHIHTHPHTYTHIYTCTHTHTPHTHPHTHTHIYTPTHTHLHIHLPPNTIFPSTGSDPSLQTQRRSLPPTQSPAFLVPGMSRASPAVSPCPCLWSGRGQGGSRPQLLCHLPCHPKQDVTKSQGPYVSGETNRSGGKSPAPGTGRGWGCPLRG